MTKARNTAKKASVAPAKPRTAAPKPPPAPVVTPRARVQVQDPAALMSRRIAGAPAEMSVVDGPKVEVNVPKAFKLTDDAHEVHEYGVGRQQMLKAHAEHFYAQANGVEIIED